jgi:hypothetical protein
MVLHRATLSIFAIACIGFVPVAFAETRPVEFLAAQAPNEHNVRNLIGIVVLNDGGDMIGKINYLLMTDKGQITTVTIGVGGLLGVGEKNVGVPFSALTITDDGNGSRIVRLAVSKQQLEAAPKFQWVETPVVVQVEETIKTGVDKVKSTAVDLGKKASEAVKTETKSTPTN